MFIIALTGLWILFSFCLAILIGRLISRRSCDYIQLDLDLDEQIVRHEEDPSRHSYWS